MRERKLDDWSVIGLGNLVWNFTIADHFASTDCENCSFGHCLPPAPTALLLCVAHWSMNYHTNSSVAVLSSKPSHTVHTEILSLVNFVSMSYIVVLYIVMYY